VSITVDATRGWALCQSAAEWTSLLAGTGIANPDNAWPGQVASGNMLDVIGSMNLVAKGTPLYAQAATGWSNTGIGADDNTTDGFTVASGTGPNPNTTSQVWMVVLSIETEPTALRAFLGVNGGTVLQVLFAPAAGVNKLRINVAGTTTTGTADHGTGSYVIFLRYDRSGAGAAKVLSDLETVTGTYAATPTDGNKGFGPAATTPGSITVLYMALWSGANAESLDDTKIGTIRSLIEAPPTGFVDDERGPSYLAAVPQWSAAIAGIASLRSIQLARGEAEELEQIAQIAFDDEYPPGYLGQVPRAVAAVAGIAAAASVKLARGDGDEIEQIAQLFVDHEQAGPRPAPKPQRQLWLRLPIQHDDTELGTVQASPPGATVDRLAIGGGNWRWVFALEAYPKALHHRHRRADARGVVGQRLGRRDHRHLGRSRERVSAVAVGTVPHRRQALDQRAGADRVERSVRRGLRGERSGQRDVLGRRFEPGHR
jgi:hypothetical protein